MKILLALAYLLFAIVAAAIGAPAYAGGLQCKPAAGSQTCPAEAGQKDGESCTCYLNGKFVQGKVVAK